jgi:hypothetical protein
MYTEHPEATLAHMQRDMPREIGESTGRYVFLQWLGRWVESVVSLDFVVFMYIGLFLPTLSLLTERCFSGSRCNNHSGRRQGGIGDGLGSCLVDANTTQHQPLHGEFLQRIRHLYSASEPIKASVGEGISISRLQNIAEATSPVKYEEEEQRADHSINCKQ